MILQDWWYTTLLSHQFSSCPPLTADLRCDVLIIGGGMSGVMAAAEFIGQGRSVVLLEKNILGGSSTGRSAGFLTPDSELELLPAHATLWRKWREGALGGALPGH